MIIGIGADIVGIDRIRGVIDRYGTRFINKCFTDDEKNQAAKRKNPVHFYAKRFAAKEAILKVLGTGMRAGLSWQDMSITNDDLGAPKVELSGGVLTAIKLKQGDNANKPIISVSLSDEDAYALAFIVIETGAEE